MIWMHVQYGSPEEVLSGEAVKDKAQKVDARAPQSPHTIEIRAHDLATRMLKKKGAKGWAQ